MRKEGSKFAKFVRRDLMNLKIGKIGRRGISRESSARVANQQKSPSKGVYAA